MCLIMELELIQFFLHLSKQFGAIGKQDGRDESAKYSSTFRLATVTDINTAQKSTIFLQWDYWGEGEETPFPLPEKLLALGTRFKSRQFVCVWCFNTKTEKVLLQGTVCLMGLTISPAHRISRNSSQWPLIYPLLEFTHLVASLFSPLDWFSPILKLL